VTKKFIIIFSAILTSVILTIAVLAIIPLLSSRQGTIKTNEGTYRHFNSISAIPGFILIKGSSKYLENRDAALNDDSVPSLFYIKSDSVEIIDYSIPANIQIQSFSGKTDAWNIKFKDYIGEYQINAAGNNGFLFLYARGNNVYGTIRFPSWGKGIQEPLKNLRIANGSISFTRSAKSKEELSRLGITTPFSQDYTGSYLHSGKTIKGSYSVQGVKKNWEAERK
jgi:hypothetical protein